MKINQNKICFDWQKSASSVDKNEFLVHRKQGSKIEIVWNKYEQKAKGLWFPENMTPTINHPTEKFMVNEHPPGEADGPENLPPRESSKLPFRLHKEEEHMVPSDQNVHAKKR